MQITRTIAEFRAARAALLANRWTLGFAPTMGALHAGHRSLVEHARAANDVVAASIFVNPKQFGPNEDLAKYPRTFEADCALLEAAGTDLLFAPSVEEMYPSGFAAVIDPGPVGTRLDGASRPGHFHGVATVVARLWNIVQPTHAYFGQKDAAQVAVLRQLARDLAFPLELVVCPTVREADGLALSSRNRYLSPAEREQSLVLSRALHAVESLARTGEHRAKPLLDAARAALVLEPAARVDYLALVHPDTLLPVESLLPNSPTLLAVAAFLGATRLIDNTLFTR